MLIRYSQQAVRDLDHIWDDIADNYVNEIREAVKGKRDQTESGTPLYYEKIFLGFWSVRYKAYRAFYRVNQVYIQAARVLLLKSSYMKTLFRISR